MDLPEMEVFRPNWGAFSLAIPITVGLVLYGVVDLTNSTSNLAGFAISVAAIIGAALFVNSKKKSFTDPTFKNQISALVSLLNQTRTNWLPNDVWGLLQSLAVCNVDPEKQEDFMKMITRFLLLVKANLAVNKQENFDGKPEKFDHDVLEEAACSLYWIIKSENGDIKGDLAFEKTFLKTFKLAVVVDKENDDNVFFILTMDKSKSAQEYVDLISHVIDDDLSLFQTFTRMFISTLTEAIQNLISQDRKMLISSRVILCGFGLCGSILENSNISDDIDSIYTFGSPLGCLGKNENDNIYSFTCLDDLVADIGPNLISRIQKFTAKLDELIPIKEQMNEIISDSLDAKNISQETMQEMSLKEEKIRLVDLTIRLWEVSMQKEDDPSQNSTTNTRYIIYHGKIYNQQKMNLKLELSSSPMSTHSSRGYLSRFREVLN